MKPTKEQIIAEANRRAAAQGYGAPPVEHFIVDVVCENWTPPEPEADPDVLAFREWRVWTGHDPDDYEPLIGHAYMAGARMAREQERERAKELVKFVEADARRLDGVGDRARAVLAKHRGEA